MSTHSTLSCLLTPQPNPTLPNPTPNLPNPIQAGEYSVALMAGDAQAKGVVWELGTFELALPAPDAAPSVRTAHTQPVSNVKPIITHLFVRVGGDGGGGGAGE